VLSDSDSGPGRFTLKKRSPTTHWITDWVGLHSWSGRFVKEKCLLHLLKIEPRFLYCASRSLGTTLNTASRLLINTNNTCLNLTYNLHFQLYSIRWISNKKENIIPFFTVWNMMVLLYDWTSTLSLKSSCLTNEKYQLQIPQSRLCGRSYLSGIYMSNEMQWETKLWANSSRGK
jgi:hypothetical protein